MLSALSAEGVEYLVVGAYALAAYGLPRATKNLDIWVGRAGDNPQRIFRALARFGAPLGQLTPDDLARDDTIFQIGVAPNRIDVLTSIEGVEFTAAWRARSNIALEGVTVPVLSREHLIRSKRAAGHPQDLVDVAWLEQQSG
jgi:hypothetical protein